MPNEIELLRELVGTASVSGNEEPVARYAESAARAAGLDVTRDATAVKMVVEGRASGGKTLALATHLDVVPPGEGWTRDPFTPVTLGDRLYGRGSGDAKASVAAMITAAADVAARGLPRGRLLVILSYGEETRNATMPQAVASLPPIDAAVVGEPTNLQVAIAQRGLMMADLVARGDQRHAGYASEGGFTNAIVALARDLVKLDTVARERRHPILGTATVTATMVQAGVSRNVTPPSAKAVLDIRSTPDWTHAELAAVIRAALESELIVTSERLVPCETPAGSALLRAASQVNPALETFGSPTCSDWVFLRHADTIKCGPGTSQRSHTPDEYVDIPEVTAARGFYAALAREYLA